MTQYWHYLLIAVLTAAVLESWRRVNRGRKPVQRDDAMGRITPGKISAAFTVLFGLALMAFGIIGLVVGQGSTGAVMLVVGLPIVLFMAPSLTHCHDVVWTPAYVEGPSRLFGLTLALRRERLAWTDVVARGRTLTGYDFVQSADGRRVYWSYLYPGHGALESEIPGCLNKFRD